MARSSIIEQALGEINRQIADLERSRDIILSASAKPGPDEKPKRTRKTSVTKHRVVMANDTGE